jgi:hypothetical protein
LPLPLLVAPLLLPLPPLLPLPLPLLLPLVPPLLLPLVPPLLLPLLPAPPELLAELPPPELLETPPLLPLPPLLLDTGPPSGPTMIVLDEQPAITASANATRKCDPPDFGITRQEIALGARRPARVTKGRQ